MNNRDINKESASFGKWFTSATFLQTHIFYSSRDEMKLSKETMKSD